MSSSVTLPPLAGAFLAAGFSAAVGLVFWDVLGEPVVAADLLTDLLSEVLRVVVARAAGFAAFGSFEFPVAMCSGLMSRCIERDSWADAVKDGFYFDPFKT